MTNLPTGPQQKTMLQRLQRLLPAPLIFGTLILSIIVGRMLKTPLLAISTGAIVTMDCDSFLSRWAQHVLPVESDVLPIEL